MEFKLFVAGENFMEEMIVMRNEEQNMSCQMWGTTSKKDVVSKSKRRVDYARCG